MMRRLPPSTLFPYTTLFRSLSSPEVSVEAITTVAGNVTVELGTVVMRSEEHTSELQSHHDLVCRLLLEKKNSSCSLLETDGYNANSQELNTVVSYFHQPGNG